MSNNSSRDAIKYSYTLESDNSIYVMNSLVFDFSLFTYASYWVAYASIVFGSLVLVHSSIINKRNLNFVRFVSDISAFFSIVFAIMFLISAYRPNKTKTAIAWDFCSIGLCQIAIQLCDSYLFVNRYRAIRRMSNLERWVTHIYIFVLIALPYHTAIMFLPFSVDLNSENAQLGDVVIRFRLGLAIQTWGIIAYNIYFTLVFSYIGYTSVKKMINQRSNSMKWIIIKNLCHCVTSSVATILLHFSYANGTFFFDYNMYNMMIVFGIHFLFNFKIEYTSFARVLADGNNTSSKIVTRSKSKLKVVNGEGSEKNRNCLPDLVDKAVNGDLEDEVMIEALGGFLEINMDDMKKNSSHSSRKRCVLLTKPVFRQKNIDQAAALKAEAV
mmetsp:Transcript_15745/g.15100  ORF Transcript_15745/g.15100 Transcript_15745/m.15100 type:complete len:384 (-) Transcript_15745:108-1259(-)